MSDGDCNLYHWERICEPRVYIHVPGSFMLGALRCVQLVNIWGGLSFFFSIKKMEKSVAFPPIGVKSFSQKQCLPFPDTLSPNKSEV